VLEVDLLQMPGDGIKDRASSKTQERRKKKKEYLL
jgi:hypothetical protein